jgi:alanyl-tRNA synthetase
MTDMRTGTRRLFYEDARMRVADAQVVRVVPGDVLDEIVLDATLFYPESGGQPCDLGRIGKHSIHSVYEVGNEIVHRIERGSGLQQGDVVRLELDWARRRDHTQQHSGQHLLSAILERDFGIHTLSFHLGTEYCTIDVSCEDHKKLDFGSIEAKAESFIASGHPFILHTCNPETARALPIRKKLPEAEEDIRIAEISDYDWVACCGTHVNNASEIRCLTILSAERYKGNSRMYFISGDRAIGWMRQECKRLERVAEALASPKKEVFEKVQAMVARLASLSAEKNALIAERARMDIEHAVHNKADSLNSATSVLFFRYESRSASEALETLKIAVGQGRVAIALSVPEKTVVVMAPGKHLGAILKEDLGITGGKGGGGQGNFRAVFTRIEEADEFATRAAARIS